MSIALGNKIIIDRYDEKNVFFFLLRAYAYTRKNIGPPSTFEIMDELEQELDFVSDAILYHNDFQVHISSLKDLTFLEDMLDFYEFHYLNLNGEECHNAQHILLKELIYL